MFETFPDIAALADAAADAVARRLAAQVSEGGAILIATGGRSPGPVYDRLKSAPLDWSRVTVGLSDERWVPSDHADSNERLVRDRLLRGQAASARFEPMFRPGVDLAEGAVQADLRMSALRPFDVVMLGMGEDGHVASLIPGDPDLASKLAPGTPRCVAPVPAGLGRPPLARLTLTLAALAEAQAIFVLVSGPAKRAVIEEGAGLPVHRLLEQAKGRVRVLWAP